MQADFARSDKRFCAEVTWLVLGALAAGAAVMGGALFLVLAVAHWVGCITGGG